MYAIVKTGGKQYRVQRGESLLVERLAADEGATVSLRALLYVDGAEVVDGDDLVNVTVEARILAHERGPKLRIVKFKPKRGYKRRNGHRQDLTRIEVATLALAPGSRGASAAAGEKPSAGAAEKASAGATATATAPAPAPGREEATDGT